MTHDYSDGSYAYAVEAKPYAQQPHTTCYIIVCINLYILQTAGETLV